MVTTPTFWAAVAAVAFTEAVPGPVKVPCRPPLPFGADPGPDPWPAPGAVPWPVLWLVELVGNPANPYPTPTPPAPIPSASTVAPPMTSPRYRRNELPAGR